jgi:hypothetical protein
VERRIRFQKIVKKCGEREILIWETSNGISKLKSGVEIFNNFLFFVVGVQMEFSFEIFTDRSSV